MALAGVPPVLTCTASLVSWCDGVALVAKSRPLTPTQLQGSWEQGWKRKSGGAVLGAALWCSSLPSAPHPSPTSSSGHSKEKHSQACGAGGGDGVGPRRREWEQASGPDFSTCCQ